jgi:ribonuclease D
MTDDRSSQRARPGAVVLVANKDELAAAAHEMAQHRLIGIDTESNSMYCYFEKVCFVQVQAGATAFIIDTVAVRDLEPLRDVFADPEITKVLHGADYDVVCLKRDFGLSFAGLFDTMLAAQFLEKPALGLAALCDSYLGARLDKSLTRHNWALRPIQQKHLHYLCGDVLHLENLFERLLDEIDARDLYPELRCEFERVADLEWSRREFDPERYTKIRGALDLDPVGRAALRELFAAREAIARELDLPAFMVLNPEHMVEVAVRRPQRPADLMPLVRAHRRLAPTHFAALTESVARVARGEVSLEPAAKPRRPRRDPREQKCEEGLRRWREKIAKIEQRPTIAILPNHVIAEVLERRPRTLDELAAIPYIGDRRVERYGPAVLDLVARMCGAD